MARDTWLESKKMRTNSKTIGARKRKIFEKQNEQNKKEKKHKLEYDGETIPSWSHSNTIRLIKKKRERKTKNEEKVRATRFRCFRFQIRFFCKLFAWQLLIK